MVNKMEKGAVFGEAGILYSRPRTTTILCKEDC